MCPKPGQTNGVSAISSCYSRSSSSSIFWKLTTNELHRLPQQKLGHNMSYAMTMNFNIVVIWIFVSTLKFCCMVLSSCRDIWYWTLCCMSDDCNEMERAVYLCGDSKLCTTCSDVPTDNIGQWHCVARVKCCSMECSDHEEQDVRCTIWCYICNWW